MAAAEELEGRTPFHVFHKVPAGDGLYVRAKHAQLVERNPEKAIALFWASLEAGDRVDSSLKDLAIVLKQQNRPHDAIFAISAFRASCSESAQDSLDNVLLDLYKSSGRLDDQIALLIRKLRAFQDTQTFNGKRTKTARSQGKKFQVSVEQEIARLLGNLGWAYMQQSNYQDAESVYRRALALEADINKVCNLGVCLMKQGKAAEAIAVLKEASFVKTNKRANSDSHWKSYERVKELSCQASSMLRSNGSPNRVDISSGSAGLPSPGLWHEVKQPHVQLDREPDDIRDINAYTEVNIGDVLLHTDVSLRDACFHIDTTASRDVEKTSERVAVAGMLACDGGDRHDDDIGAGLASVESQTCSKVLQIREEDAHSFLQAPVPNTLLSNTLWRSQMQASRRRLPVFRDITILRSAAA